MSSLLGLTLAIFSLTATAHARGAGRAFPVMAENYAIDNFQSVNPSIEWDPTNYLVDKSGEYANCDTIDRGYEDINDVTPEGLSIGVVYDFISGEGVDAESVNGYIGRIIDRWMTTDEYRTTIDEADRFGCSVRPGCRGRGELVTTVACLFSPGRWQGEQPVPGPKGLAFTKEQYNMAEKITHNIWDRSYFLENLSGIETDCAMMNEDWTFHKAKKIAEDKGMFVMGLKGSSPNRGSTQAAMEKILKGFKRIRSASQVGCSVIPDCTGDRGDIGQMMVVVSCIYEEPGYY